MLGRTRRTRNLEDQNYWGAAELIRRTKKEKFVTGVAGLAIVAAATASGCSSSDKKSDQRFNSPAPRASAEPPTSPPPNPLAPVAPPLDEKEAKSVSENYYETSKKIKAAHDVAALESVETDALLELSKARQERILQYGDNIRSGEELATNEDIKVVPPQAMPPGTDRWIFSTGKQSLSGKQRSSVGILRQNQGTGPWRMSFLAYTEPGQKLPTVTRIATQDGSGNTQASNVYKGSEICEDFAAHMNGAPTSTQWGPQVEKTRQASQRSQQELKGLTQGGSLDIKTEAQDLLDVPAWETADHKKFVICNTQTKSTVTAGFSGVVTVTHSDLFQNLAGRTTKWKNLTLVNVTMLIFMIPSDHKDPVDIIAQTVRPLSNNGTPA